MARAELARMAVMGEWHLVVSESRSAMVESLEGFGY